jgi:hypothetical protein
MSTHRALWECGPLWQLSSWGVEGALATRSWQHSIQEKLSVSVRHQSWAWEFFFFNWTKTVGRVSSDHAAKEWEFHLSSCDALWTLRAIHGCVPFHTWIQTNVHTHMGANTLDELEDGCWGIGMSDHLLATSILPVMTVCWRWLQAAV